MNTKVKDGFLESYGYNIHYLEWGETGRNILLLHSMGMDAWSMEDLARTLDDKYSVLSLTILGHGDSDIPEKGIPLPDHCEVIRSCYKQRGFVPNILVGHSVGGMMGMVIAADHPEDLEGLVLVDIAPFEHSGSKRPSPPEKFQDLDEAGGYLRERYPGFTEQYIENRLNHAFKREDDRLIMKPIGDSIRKSLDIDLWPYVKRITTPTLLLVGEHSDLVTDKTIEKMKGIMHCLSVEEVEGATHMIPQDKPEDFRERVIDFLNRI
ncbi:MAG: alpha/beta fold hydrolase [Candidatus Bathyarchaeia archaeon]